MAPTRSRSTIDREEFVPGPQFRERVDSLTRGGAKSALQQLRQALRNSQKKGDQDSIAWALVNIAMVLRGQRRYPAAIKILEDARGIFTQRGDNRGLASVYEELSIAHRELHRNALALEYAHKAVTMFQGLGRTLELAWAYDNLAVIYFNRFQRHESLTYAKRARSIFQDVGSQNGLAWNACNVANLYFEMGFFSRAIRLYREAIDNFVVLKSKQGRAWAFFRLSFVHRARCEFDTAEDLLNKARVLFEELDLKDRVGWCLLNIAAIKRATGKEEDSLLLNKRAIQLHGPLRIHDGVAWGFFQNGQIFRDRGQLVKAWQTLREALNLHTDISNRLGMGWAENEMGKTYLELNGESHARECFMKARTAAEELDAGPLKADVYKNLANLGLDEALMDQAHELLELAEKCAQKIHLWETQAEIRLVRARRCALLGEPENAEAATAAAKTLILDHGLQRLKPTLGVFLGESLMAAGKTAEAVSVWQDTAQLAKKMRQRRQHAEALLGLIEAQRRTKTPAQISLALFHLEKEIRAVGSRKLKAKFILVKGLITHETTGSFDPRFVSQAAQIAGSAGLKVLQRFILETAALAAGRSGRTPEADDIGRDLKALMEAGSTGLRAIRFDPRRADAFPVSIIL